MSVSYATFEDRILCRSKKIAKSNVASRKNLHL